MAEHRRVEPRSILGSGMATDPERVQEIEEEAARRERTWRERGDVNFGEVLKHAPPRAGDDDSEGRKQQAPEDEPQDAAAPDASAGPPAAPEAAAARPRPTGPRLPPDPRARQLHQLLEQKNPKPPTASPAPVKLTSTETPPTGSQKAGSPKAGSPKVGGPKVGGQNADSPKAGSSTAGSAKEASGVNPAARGTKKGPV